MVAAEGTGVDVWWGVDLPLPDAEVAPFPFPFFLPPALMAPNEGVAVALPLVPLQPVAAPPDVVVEGNSVDVGSGSGGGATIFFGLLMA